jgi:hypothetical protein
MSKEHDVRAVAREFKIDGEFVAAAPHGSGHINDTYCVVFRREGLQFRSILQRINTNIFKNPAALMENVQQVTSHLAAQTADEPDCDRRVLSLIATRDGHAWYEDADGSFWRAYRFIERARSYDCVESAAQAFQAGKAFGRFQQLLVSLPSPRLHDTIPDFHNTPKRFLALEQAIERDVADRAIVCKKEIEFALAHRPITRVLLDANLPERVTHNDTKLNNVLLDDTTGEGICVIDLDTVMPGVSLYDFGDMMRTTTSPTSEDERDLSKVKSQFPMFEALARGYLSSAGKFLSEAEKEKLVTSGMLIAFEQGVRFLADFLGGDVYYKVHRDRHNLDRCRTQFKLVESIEQQQERMERLVHLIAE